MSRRSSCYWDEFAVWSVGRLLVSDGGNMFSCLAAAAAAS